MPLSVPRRRPCGQLVAIRPDGRRLLPRDRDGSDVRWFEIDPCYVFHTVNAYEENDTVVVDVVRHDRMFATDLTGPNEGPASLTRFVIDLTAGKVRKDAYDQRSQEFPRIDERLTGRRHRFGYAIGLAGPAPGDSALKHDLVAGTTQSRALGTGREASEFCFVPTPSGTAEDYGVLLGYVFEKARGRSDLRVLDAQTLEDVATVQLPGRVPAGFHGNWAPTAPATTPAEKGSRHAESGCAGLREDPAHGRPFSETRWLNAQPPKRRLVRSHHMERPAWLLPGRRVQRGAQRPSGEKVIDVSAVETGVGEAKHVAGSRQHVLDRVGDAAAQGGGRLLTDEGVVVGGQDQGWHVDAVQLATVVGGEGGLGACSVGAPRRVLPEQLGRLGLAQRVIAFVVVGASKRCGVQSQRQVPVERPGEETGGADLGATDAAGHGICREAAGEHESTQPIGPADGDSQRDHGAEAVADEDELVEVTNLIQDMVGVRLDAVHAVR
jgi:hypothetical protein